jgi:hypothetical protein
MMIKLVRVLMVTGALLLVLLVYQKAKAQVSGTTVSFTAVPSTAISTGCPLPTVGYTIYCQASDKYQISANGSPYIVIWPAGTVTAGVTSWNGQTGNVVYTPPIAPVQSVNGKTGTVVISANTTLQ